MKKIFFNNYFKKFNVVLNILDTNYLYKSVKLIIKHHKIGGRIIIARNWGSASIASHICGDFAKELSIKAVNFNEANLITCFVNDFGYENWLKKALEIYTQKNNKVF